MQDDATLIKMIKCSAHGYLRKNVHPPELEKALDALLEKGFYYPDSATNRVLHNIGTEQNEAEPAIKLSEREINFLRYACIELAYKEIGEKMLVSPRTVESYRDVLFEKPGLKIRVGLVMYAVRNGLSEN